MTRPESARLHKLAAWFNAHPEVDVPTITPAGCHWDVVGRPDAEMSILRLVDNWKVMHRSTLMAHLVGFHAELGAVHLTIDRYVSSEERDYEALGIAVPKAVAS